MGKQITISHGNLRATIDCLGAEVISLTKDNNQIIWQGDARFWNGRAPVLFPVCGGLKNDCYFLDGKRYDMPKHGFAKKLEFVPVSVEKDRASFLLTENSQTLAVFPFKFNFYINYVIDNGLKVEYVVENKDDKQMYFTIGAHEGYVLSDEFTDYSIIFSQPENIFAIGLEGSLITDDYINYGENVKELRLNYAYFEQDAIILKNIKSKKVSIKNNRTGKNCLSVDFADFKHLLLWTKPNAPYICIEPWVALPDQVYASGNIEEKTDVVKLLAGQTIKFTHVITLD